MDYTLDSARHVVIHGSALERMQASLWLENKIKDFRNNKKARHVLEEHKEEAVNKAVNEKARQVLDKYPRVVQPAEEEKMNEEEVKEVEEHQEEEKDQEMEDDEEWQEEWNIEQERSLEGVDTLDEAFGRERSLEDIDTLIVTCGLQHFESAWNWHWLHARKFQIAGVSSLYWCRHQAPS